MGSDSRTRMLVSAAELLRERGLSRTSFREVIEHSGAPRGSIYHHFPGGKGQLMQDAVRFAGAVGEDVLTLDAGENDPVVFLRRFINQWASSLRESDFRAGCPIVAVVTDGFEDDGDLRTAASDVFDSWHGVVAAVLRRRGVTPAQARRTATMVVASVEGAVVLCRAHRSTTPLRDVGKELESYLTAVAGPQS